ncbi:flavodoxin [bacterium DOLJORAL78_65_58]|nr:MAG: flavodoxin [bacterium DOLZORAL124_64_63]PIE76754.1 MAG: flavodoxin [bacterium DOLJORAL78_65_58]
METIGLFFGSTTGNTQDMAELIAEKMPNPVELKDVADCSPEDMLSYSGLILGMSTWGEGELQDDWEDFLPDMEDLDLSGKTVALFGLGDSDGYQETFVDALGIVYEKVVACGAKVVGSWPTDGYSFDGSAAVVDGKFAGLVLDVDNEGHKSEERITAWVEQISSSF